MDYYDGTTQLQVPFNYEAEESVLGSILLDRDSLIKVADRLQPSDFHRETNQQIYAAMLRLYKRREPSDPVTLHAELTRRGHGKYIKQADLIGLAARTPTATHILHYARIVEETSIMRRLISVGGEIAGLGYTSDISPTEALSKASNLLMQLQDRGSRGDHDYRSMEELASRFLDRMEELQGNPHMNRGVPSGFSDLDDITGGFQNSDFIVLAGRPGTGKTALALDIAHNAAQRTDHEGEPYRVGIFEFEMEDSQLFGRAIALETGIDTRRLRVGDFSDPERARIQDAAGRLAGLPIFIDDRPSVRIDQLRARVHRMHAREGLSMVIVDYLQLAHGTPSKDNNRVQEIGEISRKLKLLAREIKRPVIACAQLNRAVEARSSKVAVLSDLREGGSIEQDADMVIFIHRPEMYDDDPKYVNLAELHIAKHRNGPLATVPLRYFAATTRFAGLDNIHTYGGQAA